MNKGFIFSWRDLLIFTLSVFSPFSPFLLIYFDVPFLHFIPIKATTAIELLEQRTGQLATLVSLALVVAGFLMNVMAGKNKLTTETLIRNSRIFPITVFSLSVVAYLIVLSTFRDVWVINPTRFNNLFLAGSYMALGVIGLIGFLFWKTINFLDNDMIQKIIRNQFTSELEEISREYLIDTKQNKGSKSNDISPPVYQKLLQLSYINSFWDDLDNAIQNDDSVRIQNTLRGFKITYDDIFKYLRNTSGGLETLTEGLNGLLSHRFLYCCRENSPKTIEHFIDFYDHLLQEFISKQMPNSFESAIQNLPIAYQTINDQLKSKPLHKEEFQKLTEAIITKLVALTSYIFDFDSANAETNFNLWEKEVREISYRIGSNNPAATDLLLRVNEKLTHLRPWGWERVTPEKAGEYDQKAYALIGFLESRAPSDSVSPD